jgi:GNAT superfamily N-acetyltransferase
MTPPDDRRWKLLPAADGEGDVRIVGASEAGSVPQATLWYRATPLRAGRRTAFVGALAADDPATLAAMLRRAVPAAHAAGCDEILGPIDGSTWRRYRAVTWSDGQPPFPMEPLSPAWWPDAFEQAGFAVAETYHSAVDATPPSAADRAACATREQALAAHGITIRTLDRCEPIAALDAMFELSIEGFADNPLAAPIDRSAFHAMYAPLLTKVHPALALLAFDADARPAGFMFGFPALGWPLATGAPAIVLKSIAVRRSVRGSGLGRVLLERCRHAGWDLGAHRTIYALMHDDNRSARMLTETAQVLRRYAVYGRRCAP